MDTIQFVATTPEKLRTDISEDLKGQLVDFFQDREKDDRLLTRNEAAEFLKIDLSTLWAWTKAKKLKAYGISNRVYYKKNELLESLKPLNK